MGYAEICFGNHGDFKGVPHTTFVENKTIRYAVERLLLIIGLRNILAHEYGEVKMDKIYLATTKSIPVLLESLVPLLQE